MLNSRKLDQLDDTMGPSANLKSFKNGFQRSHIPRASDSLS